MAADRTVLAAVVSAGLLAVPACSLRVGGWNLAPDPVVPAPPAAPPQHKFASLPRSPGERIPLNHTQTVGRNTDEPPPIQVPDVIKVTPLTPPPPVTPPPPPPDKPLVGYVRAHLDDDPQKAARLLEQFPKPNQDLLNQLVPAVVRAAQLDFATASPTEVAVLAQQIEGPVAALNTRAPLFIDKAVFCRSVANFGRYDPLPDKHPFGPGKVAELYVEVRNAPSEPTEGGYVTQLVCTLQVQDAAGNPVLLPDRTRQPVPRLHETKRDVTRSPLRDYFLLYRFPVPASPGDYAVTFEVQDPATGRAVSRTMRLRVE